MLAHTITSLSALSGGRVVLGIGAGGLWDEITKLGVRRLSAGAAVRAMEEAIILVKALSGGSAGQWIEELTGAVLEHGAAGSLYREELEHTSDQALRRWAEDIVPAVRDAVAKV